MARLLGLDLGDRRIGVAISDESWLLARTLTTIVRTSRRQAWEDIGRLAAAHDAQRLIVGLPRTLRGEEGLQARRVRRSAEALSAAIGLPVDFQDERYTSREAQERLAATRRRPAKADIDAAAAAIILQDYLDRHASPGAEPRPAPPSAAQTGIHRAGHAEEER